MQGSYSSRLLARVAGRVAEVQCKAGRTLDAAAERPAEHALQLFGQNKSWPRQPPPRCGAPTESRRARGRPMHFRWTTEVDHALEVL